MRLLRETDVGMRNRAIRSAFYAYFAVGMALLSSASAASIVRFAPNKGFAVGYLTVIALGIFGVLAVANWDVCARPVSARKWIALCSLSTLGFVSTMLLSGIYAGSAL